MFEVSRKATRAEIRSADEFGAIRKGLRDRGYTAVVNSMEDALCDTLGIDSGRLQLGSLLSDRRIYRGYRDDNKPLGEMFAKNRSLFLVAPVSSRLSVWELRFHRDASLLEEFLASLEEVIRERLDGRRVRGMDFNWKDEKAPLSNRAALVRSRTARRAGDKLQTKEALFSEDELARSTLVADGANRTFLIGLAKVGNKARSVDAASLLEEDRIEALLDAEIIRREYLLVCRQDSRTICSIPDKDKLEATIGSELSCTSCGRAFNDELIQEIYALTEEGRRLLSASQWMTIWVTAALVEAGVPRESIEWNAAAGEDELDIVADIHGLRVFFELKDREFGLGDAYPFSASFEI